MRERSPGVWELRVFLGRDPLTDRKRYRSRTFRGRKREAETALAELVTGAGGDRALTTDATVAELLERWLETIEADRSPTTIREYRRLVDRRIGPAIGARRVDELATAELDRFYGALRAKGLSPASIRQVHAIIRRALRQAEQWDLLEKNPARNASPPKGGRREISPPEPADVGRLLRAADKSHPQMGVLFRVAAATGARRGELCALRWSDVDLDRRLISISRSIADMGLVVKDTKTHASRKVTVDPATAALLEQHRQAQADRSTGSLVDDAFVFSPRLDGARPWAPMSVTQAFRRVCKATGLEGVRLHDLRHFNATRLLDEGLPVRTVAGRLGHAKTSTTMDIYAAWVPERDDEAAAAIGRVLDA